jgi:hypothetical protein
MDGDGLHDTTTREISDYDDEEGERQEDRAFVLFHIAGVTVCVFTAALTAGLTMGLMSLNILELKIKIASGSEEERLRAQIVLPICKWCAIITEA